MSDISALGQAPDGPPALLADRAYEELRDRLVTLQIKPGEPIDEDRLGADLEMGRTPIREAIKRLSLENLVTVFPRRGTFAAEINIKDLAQITEVRAVLEARAAALAAERLTDAAREELTALIEELRASRGADDMNALMTLDTRIHRFIYRACANPFLEQTLYRYFNLSLRIWYLVLDRLPHIVARVDEHREVLQDIEAGDPERARDTMAEHVETFAREIRAVL